MISTPCFAATVDESFTAQAVALHRAHDAAAGLVGRTDEGQAAARRSLAERATSLEEVVEGATGSRPLQPPTRAEGPAAQGGPMTREGPDVETPVPSPCRRAWDVLGERGDIVANIPGAFLLGILMAFMLDVWATTRLLRPFVGVGVLGGYTTFSTWMLDTHAVVAGGEYLVAMAYVLSTLVVGLLAVWLGAVTGRGDRHHRHPQGCAPTCSAGWALMAAL